MPWQRHFSFSPKQRDWTTTGQGCHRLFHCLLPPLKLLHRSIVPQHCLLSDQGTLPGVFCSLAGKGNFFPITEIHKDQTKGSCKATSSGEDCGWIMTAQPGRNSLPLVTKEKCVRSCLILKLPCLSWQILDIFPQVAFTWSNRDQSLLGEVRWVSARSSHCRTSPPSDEDRPLEGLVVVPGLPSISLFLHYSQTSTVHPLTLVLEMECFPSISTENHMWKFSQNGTSTTPLDFCGTQTSKRLT